MVRCGLYVALLGGAARVANAEPEPPAPAVADERLPVVDVVWDRDPTEVEQGALWRRVIAELELRGFEVHIVAEPSPLSDDDDRAAPLGAVELDTNADGTSPSLRWTPRAELGGRESVPLLHGPDAPEVAAVQVAELVVATFENASVASPKEPPAEPSAAVEAEVPPPPRSLAPRWRVGLGFGVGVSPGGLGVVAGPALSASVSLGARRRFGASLDATGFPIAAAVSHDSGEHRVGLASVRAHASWWPLPTARLSPSVGLGGGTLIGWAQGRGSTAVGLLSARADVAVGLGDRLALWLGTQVGVAVPRVEVRMQEQVLATAGQPLLDLTLGLRIRG